MPNDKWKMIGYHAFNDSLVPYRARMLASARLLSEKRAPAAAILASQEARLTIKRAAPLPLAEVG